jgi:hypothetical protein
LTRKIKNGGLKKRLAREIADEEDAYDLEHEEGEYAIGGQNEESNKSK